MPSDWMTVLAQGLEVALLQLLARRRMLRTTVLATSNPITSILHTTRAKRGRGHPRDSSSRSGGRHSAHFLQLLCSKRCCDFSPVR